jgi:hypothetical protein
LRDNCTACRIRIKPGDVQIQQDHQHSREIYSSHISPYHLLIGRYGTSVSDMPGEDSRLTELRPCTSPRPRKRLTHSGIFYVSKSANYQRPRLQIAPCSAVLDSSTPHHTSPLTKQHRHVQIQQQQDESADTLSRCRGRYWNCETEKINSSPTGQTFVCHRFCIQAVISQSVPSASIIEQAFFSPSIIVPSSAS